MKMTITYSRDKLSWNRREWDERGGCQIESIERERERERENEGRERGEKEERERRKKKRENETRSSRKCSICDTLTHSHTLNRRDLRGRS